MRTIKIWTGDNVYMVKVGEYSPGCPRLLQRFSNSNKNYNNTRKVGQSKQATETTLIYLDNFRSVNLLNTN